MSAPEPYSYRIYKPKEGGAIKHVPVPFPFIDRTNVRVFEGAKEIDPAKYDWVSDGEIVLEEPSMVTVTVRRFTWEDDQLVAWKDGSYELADDHNLSDMQMLYLIQEHHDWIGWVASGSPPLPGPGFPDQSYGLWNRMPRWADPDAFTPDEHAQTVTRKDQLLSQGDGWSSTGWLSDDAHVATTGALSERFDVIVSDTTPPIPAPSYRQVGKLWINSLRLKMYYWLPGQVQAWVELPLYRPGLGGGGGGGSSAPPTAVKAPLRRQVIQGNDTILFDLNILLPLGV